MRDPQAPETPELVSVARRLWAGAFRGVLSTHSQAHPGYPFGSLAPYCLDRSGRPVLLLSHLAQHSRNLAHDPRCGLLVSGEDGDDVQQVPRLSALADSTPIDGDLDETAERYFRYFPQTRPYYEQLNFLFFRLTPRCLHLNAGFAAARWLGPERVLTPSPLDSAQESELISELESAHATLLAQLMDANGQGPVRVAGIDGEGIDLKRGAALKRFPFTHTARDPHEALTRALILGKST